MEKVIYSNNGGLGLILENEEKESDFIENQSFVVNGEEIKPGYFYDLSGYFLQPMRFCGALVENNKWMVFHTCNVVGNNDRIEKRIYYCVCVISGKLIYPPKKRTRF